MIKIGNKQIGATERMFIIAEIGVNHQGSLALAKKMIELADSAGADAVKFQMFRTAEMVSDQADLAEYQKNSHYQTQKELLTDLELTEEEFQELKKYCDDRGIIFLSTPFDLKSAEVLNKMGVEVFKVGSGDLTNYPLLLSLKNFDKPIILSTGMANLAEIEGALEFLGSSTNIALLHCTSAYPAPYADLNLRAIDTLKHSFQKVIGYSDHSQGLAVPYAAASLGFKILEKHFTYNKNAIGPDHQTSLEPQEFKEMVAGIRQIELALGSSQKTIAKSEQENKYLVRKGIYLAEDIESGQQLTLANLAFLRPQQGLGAEHYLEVIGKKATTTLKKGHPLTWQDLN